MLDEELAFFEGLGRDLDLGKGLTLERVALAELEEELTEAEAEEEMGAPWGGTTVAPERAEAVAETKADAGEAGERRVVLVRESKAQKNKKINSSH